MVDTAFALHSRRTTAGERIANPAADQHPTPMGRSGMTSLAYLAFGIVGSLFLLVTAACLGFLAIGWLHRSPPGRKLSGQELVWSLVPALVLVWLTVASDLPRGWGRVPAGSVGAIALESAPGR
jgi:hypothetical protein